MEETKIPFGIFRQPESITPSISEWKLRREMLDMYYERPEARQFIEDLSARLNLDMNLEQFKSYLENIEKFEKEV
ncbi:MAG: hypothetical protein ABIG90_00900 [bacterium]